MLAGMGRDVGRGFTDGKWSGRRGSNSQLSAWESKSPLLYFHNLQNESGKINVHATHTVHALPDLRVAGGRLGDGFFSSTCRSNTSNRKVGWLLRQTSY
jgi:hypothetical protein